MSKTPVKVSLISVIVARIEQDLGKSVFNKRTQGQIWEELGKMPQETEIYNWFRNPL